MTKHEVLHEGAQPGDIKMTLPSANQFPAIAFKKGITDAFYKDYTEFLWDCAPIIAEEVKALGNEGQYIQLDAPRYSYYIDPKWRKYVQDEMGMDPEAALDDAIKVDNLLRRRHRQGRRPHLHPPLPRQQPQPVVRRGRLRPDRREAVQPAQLRRVLARVRDRALRQLRAAALRAQGQDGGAGPDQQQGAGRSSRRRSSSRASTRPRSTCRWRSWR